MRITINDEVIEEHVCESICQELAVQYPFKQADDIQKMASDSLIKQVLLRQQSADEIGEVPEDVVNDEFAQYKRNFESEADFEVMCAQNHVTEFQIKQEIANNLRINALLQKILGHPPNIPNRVLKEYYDKNPAVANKPLQIHAGHIVKNVDPNNPKKTYNEMLRLRQKLLEGADFRKLATDNSDCSENHGDLGLIASGDMVEEFEAVIFSMNKGEISPVFKSPFGYHIATVFEISPKCKLSFDACKEHIETEIMEKMQDQKIDEWLKKIKAKSKIKIDW